MRQQRSCPDKLRSHLRMAKAYSDLIPIMTREQRVSFYVLVGLWLLSLVLFWAWWLQDKHLTSWFGMALNSLFLLWNTVLPGYFFFFVSRMRKMDERIPIPESWRVAMVLTKAPSEPWPLVKETLIAMLAQSFPHDTWLADEDPQPHVVEWCARAGILLSTRRGIEAYHQPSWPRRTKCKEGNLAYFYDHYGYDRYDFVVQMDADHVPEANYLVHMLRPFRDERVGYVAAPSICGKNAKDSWVVNARLFAESTLHGCLQAGYHEGWAPLCIGSHYAVRTRALKQIGGLGPELAEDHTTTLMMNAAGWQGGFAFEAEAHGQGPNCFKDFLVQEWQWSASLTRTLLMITPGFWSRLTSRLKLQFAFSQMWYPLFGLCMLLGTLMPLIALWCDTPWVNVSYLEFLARYGLLNFTALIPILWLKKQGWLRPKEARVWSWEPIIFQLVRWPWVIMGVSQGVIAALTRKDTRFRVTPKARQEAGLPAFVLLPYWMVSGLSGGTAILCRDAAESKGYVFLALLSAVIYFFVGIVIIFRHAMENPQRYRVAWGVKLTAAAMASLLMIGTIQALPASLPVIMNSSFSNFGVGKVQVVKGGGSATQKNAEASQLALGVYDPAQSWSGPSILIDHSFVTWRLDQAKELSTALEQARRLGRTPMITLEPWPWEWQGMTKETLFQDILQGKYDPTLNRIFQVLGQEAPKPILFRWAHEMENIGQYPWAKAQAEEYIQVYRYVYDLAAKHSLNHLLWVWSPVGNKEAYRYWPGNSYVDYIGISMYASQAYDKSLGFENTRSFEQLISEKYWLAEHYQKPLIVAELGVSQDVPDRQAWFQEALASLRKFPLLKAILYFNQVQPDIVPFPLGKPDWSMKPVEIAGILGAWQKDRHACLSSDEFRKSLQKNTEPKSGRQN